MITFTGHQVWELEDLELSLLGRWGPARKVLVYPHKESGLPLGNWEPLKDYRLEKDRVRFVFPKGLDVPPCGIAAPEPREN